mmetsp:Transcript_68696/g.163899  ORF Transcript_68696/g.163899 Transcript_68696/m.163899 type:complete len:215 (+) Transcript_68696:5252-5896(+)
MELRAEAAPPRVVHGAGGGDVPVDVLHNSGHHLDLHRPPLPAPRVRALHPGIHWSHSGRLALRLQVEPGAAADRARDRAARGDGGGAADGAPPAGYHRVDDRRSDPEGAAHQEDDVDLADEQRGFDGRRPQRGADLPVHRVHGVHGRRGTAARQVSHRPGGADSGRRGGQRAERPRNPRTGHQLGFARDRRRGDAAHPLCRPTDRDGAAAPQGV